LVENQNLKKDNDDLNTLTNNLKQMCKNNEENYGSLKNLANKNQELEQIKHAYIDIQKNDDDLINKINEINSVNQIAQENEEINALLAEKNHREYCLE